MGLLDPFPTFAVAMMVEVSELALREDSIGSLFELPNQCLGIYVYAGPIKSLLYRLSSQSPGAYVRTTKSTVNFL
jgi:hypothetical protein